MANTYTLISSVTVGSGGAANIEFTSIPSSYTDLVLKVSARNTTAISYASVLYLKFNNSSTSIYDQRTLRTNYSTASSTADTGKSTFELIGGSNRDTSTASTFSNFEMYIPNYTSANNKSISSDGAVESNDTTLNTVAGGFTAGLFNNTSAVSSIQITTDGNFLQYSTAYLYGISNA